MLTGIGPRRTLVMLLGTALCGALVLLGALVLTPPLPVAATGTKHVTNCSDSGVANDGSLRGEIAAAPATYTIVFNVDCTSATPITLSSTITLTTNLAIDGIGRTIVVDGGGAHTVFSVNSGVTATLNNLTIQHGHGGSGGGIFNNGGMLFVTNSTFSGNSAPGNDGGGIVNFGIGTVTVTNSTFTGNSAARGGGIQNFGHTATVTNTIVAGNTATSSGPDVAGTYTSGGNNLIGQTDGSMGFTGTGDQTGAGANPLNPRLGTLGSNGGPTPTIPLLAGSPAVGHGKTTVCANTGGTGPVARKDQRGLPRPMATCAIGAFEPQQATYTVGSLSDSASAAMDTFANCQSATNTTCKLRDALAYASSGLDTIAFNGTGTGTITLTNDMTHGTLTPAASVTITGPTSGAGVIVDGGCTGCDPGQTPSGGVTVFTVNSGVTVSLSNLTIQHGLAAPNCNGATCGGGILNNGGMLTLTNSTLSSNSAGTGNNAYGGGIAINGGTVTLTNSTLSGNSATYGGGIYIPGGMLFLTNSTLSGNSAANGIGGGIRNTQGMVTLTNTIVAGNTSHETSGPDLGPDLAGTITTGGHNLIGDTTSSTGITNGDAQGDIVNNMPLLGTLGSNGGTTQTIPLLAGSPAVGAGDPSATGCGAAGVNEKDQRGFGRSMAKCSIGSFEPQTAPYTVGNFSDTGAMDTLTNCQNGGNTTCKLRDALAYAASGSDTVMFNGGGQTIMLTNDAQHGTLTLGASVTITGPTSGAAVIVDGNNAVRVFTVNTGVTASLSNLAIQHGNDSASGDCFLFNCGGGIANLGTLTVTNSVLSANAAHGTNSKGGGIYNGGTLTLTNSTLADNSAPNANGGGIYNNGGMVTLTNSTLSGNSAVQCGGIYNNGGMVTLTNSTLSSNSALGNGGGIYANGGMVTLTNSTLSSNSALGNGNGGGIYINDGMVTVRNTIVAGNTATTGADISGTVTNIRSMIGGDPMLASLANNGGPTQTRLPLPGSPVIGDGDSSICNETTGTAPVNGKDQRGFARPTDLCALGAAEPVLSRISPAAGATTGGNTVTLTGSGFAAGTTSVSIGGANCASVQVVNSTTLTCTVAAHAVGAVDVVVTEGSLTGTLTGGYTYPVIAPQPTPPHPVTTTTGMPNAVAATHTAGSVVGGMGTPMPQPMRHP